MRDHEMTQGMLKHILRNVNTELCTLSIPG